MGTIRDEIEDLFALELPEGEWSGTDWGGIYLIRRAEVLSILAGWKLVGEYTMPSQYETLEAELALWDIARKVIARSKEDDIIAIYVRRGKEDE